MKNTLKKILIFFLKLLIVGGAFTYLISRGQLQWEDIRASFSHPGYIAIGTLLAFLPMVISFYRHYVLLRALGIKNYSVLDVTRIGFIGCFFSTFMPGAMGGDVIKAGYIIHDTRENARAIASVLIDRVQGLFGLLIIGGLAMILVHYDVINTPSLHKIAVAVFSIIGVAVCGGSIGILAILVGRKIAFAAWIILAAVGAYGAWRLYDDCGQVFQFIRHPEETLTPTLAVILLCGRFIVAIGGCILAALLCLIIVPSCQPGHHFARFVCHRIPGGKQLMSLADAVLLFHNNVPVLFYTLFMSLLTHGFNLFSVYYFSKAVGLTTPPTLFSVFFAAPIAFVANSLPVPGGGLGVGEAVFAEVLSLCRSDAGEVIVGGATVFLTWRIWYVLLSLAGGLPCYLAGRGEIAVVREELATEGTSPSSADQIPSENPVKVEKKIN